MKRTTTTAVTSTSTRTTTGTSSLVLWGKYNWMIIKQHLKNSTWVFTDGEFRQKDNNGRNCILKHCGVMLWNKTQVKFMGPCDNWSLCHSQCVSTLRKAITEHSGLPHRLLFSSDIDPGSQAWCTRHYDCDLAHAEIMSSNHWMCTA